MAETALCRVSRPACEACCAESAPSPENLNHVLASHLFGLTREVISEGGVPGCDSESARELQFWAELNLPSFKEPGPRRGESIRYRSPEYYSGKQRNYRCDVVICCEDSGSETQRAIESVLEQENAQTQVHLVDDGGGAARLLERYSKVGNVEVHRNARRRGVFATIHDLVPRLQSEFVAVQDPRTRSRAHRVCYSVGLLEDNRAEVLAAALETPDGVVRPEPLSSEYRRFVPSATLVFRRAALVDMGGMALRDSDDDAEIVFRAHRQQRILLLAPEVTVEGQDHFSRSPLGPSPHYETVHGIPQLRVQGFPREEVECDVVLPFHGHLNYLKTALTSILEQEGADLVVHLIDDASEESTHEVLRYWGSHPRIRTYRNTRNVGQFTSFNNVVPYLETGLVAVQDADDVSLPHRIHLAGNLLRLAGGDIFGGRSQYIGPDGSTNGLSSGRVFCRSRYPKPGGDWFLMNPTAVMRVDAFLSLGGFADFGDVLRNRCGADTEFYSRAYHHGGRFAISRQEVLQYRKHDDQATHNSLTGWTTRPRAWTIRECRRRERLYQEGPFDPRTFGSLGKHDSVTQRLGGARG